MGLKKVAFTFNHGVLVISLGLALVAGTFLVKTYLLSKSITDDETGSVVAITEAMDDEQLIINEWYAPLYPMTIGSTSIQVSIADTPKDRMQGLSETPYLPEGIGKLFVFEESNTWGFWMKDMNYAIDIIWINDEGFVVHIEEAVSPDTYPKTFMPRFLAQYVLEVPSGFVAKEEIGLGDTVSLPIRR